jgi:hypothetical protein
MPHGLSFAVHWLVNPRTAGDWRCWLPLCLVLSGPHWAVQAQQPNSGGDATGTGGVAIDAMAPLVLEDVEAAFARLQVRGEHLTARAGELIPKPRYRPSASNLFGLWNHFQGIQRPPQSNYLVISGSNPRSSRAELFIVRQGDDGSGQVVANIGLDPVMWHAGGLSMLGTMLAVPVWGGSPRHAKVLFYDVGIPEQPRKLPIEISRPSRKGSATALTRLANGHYLVAVLSAYDGLPLRMDFYRSRTQALDDGFVPEPVTWRASKVQARPGQERTFSHFQNINFISQADGRLFLVGFHNTFLSPTTLPGRDYADLYQVVFPDASVRRDSPRLEEPAIVKTAHRLLRCTSGYCNMDAAAGLYIDPDTRSLSVYAMAGWLNGDTMKLTVYRSGSGAR